MLYPADRGSMYGALPWVWGNRGIKIFIPGEHGNKDLQMSEHVNKGNFGESRETKIFILENRGTKRLTSGEQGNRYPRRASCMP